jgi:hypothetical protein
MLERWTLHVTARHAAKALPHQFLVQAIRSQLAFSQLNASIASWQQTAAGAPPFDIVYRVTLPAESLTAWPASAAAHLDTHIFPECQLSRHHILTVVVIRPQRRVDVPSLPRNAHCAHCRSMRTGNAPTTGSAISTYANPLFAITATMPATSEPELKQRFAAIHLQPPAPRQDYKKAEPVVQCEDDDISPCNSSSNASSFSSLISAAEQRPSPDAGPSERKRQRRQSTKILFSSTPTADVDCADKLDSGFADCFLSDRDLFIDTSSSSEPTDER